MTDPAPTHRIVTGKEALKIAPAVTTLIRDITQTIARQNPPPSNGDVLAALFNVIATNVVMSEVLSELETGRTSSVNSCSQLAEVASNLLRVSVTEMARHEDEKRTIHNHLSLVLSKTAGNA